MRPRDDRAAPEAEPPPGRLDPDRDRYCTLIETIADAVLVVSTDGDIRYANQAAQALLGRPGVHLVGQVFGVPVVPGETTEVEVPHAPGGLRIAEMRASATVWAGEHAVLATLRDVTERRRAEEELKAADRRKDAFLAMLSHELRNPLAPIRNAVALMRMREPADPETRHARDVIDRQVVHLTRLIDDLLDVARLTHGKVRLRKDHVSLDRVVTDALETSRPLIAAKGQVLDVDLPGRPVTLLADPTRMAQVIANLLNNASKYTPAGGRVALSVSAHGEVLAVRVRDDGVGIPPEMLARVFDLFTQLDNPAAHAAGGLGIGLTVVRNLVEMHGGTVLARSDGPDRGSEFVVEVPCVVPAPRPAAGGPEEPAALRSPAPRRVLIVEDNQPAAETLASILDLCGHESRIASDGLDALRVFESFRPDVVLLDIGLPGMDGFEVARRLRAVPGHGIELLVAMTGYAEHEIACKSAEAGFHHHLLKPTDPEALLRLLNRR